MQYVIHPLANLLPMIPEAELKDMAENIKKNGQRFSIVRWHGQIIDGRNRLRACELAGVPPVIKDKDNELADEDAVSNFILTANFVRRHLDASQRAALAAELVDTFDKIRAAEAASNSGKTDEDEAPPTGTEQAPDEDTDEAEAETDGEGEEDSPEEAEEAEEAPKAPRDKTKRVKAAAEKMHTSPAYVHEAGRLKRDAPEKYEEVKEGKKTLSRAKKELQEEKGTPEISDEKKLAKAEKLVEKCQVKLGELGYTLVQTKIAPL